MREQVEPRLRAQPGDRRLQHLPRGGAHVDVEAGEQAARDREARGGRIDSLDLHRVGASEQDRRPCVVASEREIEDDEFGPLHPPRQVGQQGIIDLVGCVADEVGEPRAGGHRARGAAERASRGEARFGALAARSGVDADDFVRPGSSGAAHGLERTGPPCEVGFAHRVSCIEHDAARQRLRVGARKAEMRERIDRFAAKDMVRIPTGLEHRGRIAALGGAIFEVVAQRLVLELAHILVLLEVVGDVELGHGRRPSRQP